MTYYVAETINGGAININELWEKTKARSLDGAKRAAKRRQTFYGTWLYVGWKDNDDSGVIVESCFVCDAINYKGYWSDVIEISKNALDKP